MEESFDFDLSFLGQYHRETDINSACDLQNLARRISDSNELIQALKKLQNENDFLKHRLNDLQKSACNIQSMYAEERLKSTGLIATNTELSKRLDDAENRAVTLESELTQKNLYYNQTEENCKETLKSERIRYTELEAQLREYQEKFLSTKATDTIQKSRFECTCSVQGALPNALSPPLLGKREISKRYVSRGTQYKYSTTTRSTCTSVFINKRNVGTNFPEVVPFSIEQILKETTVDIPCPLSPITDSWQLTRSVGTQVRYETPSCDVGTCTNICNIRNDLDVAQKTCVKMESDLEKIAHKPTCQLSDLWDLLGQTIFALINTNGASEQLNSTDFQQRIESFKNRFTKSSAQSSGLKSCDRVFESKEEIIQLALEGSVGASNMTSSAEVALPIDSDVTQRSVVSTSPLSGKPPVELNSDAEDQILAIKNEFEELNKKCVIISPIRDSRVFKVTTVDREPAQFSRNHLNSSTELKSQHQEITKTILHTKQRSKCFRSKKARQRHLKTLSKRLLMTAICNVEKVELKEEDLFVKSNHVCEINQSASSAPELMQISEETNNSLNDIKLVPEKESVQSKDEYLMLSPLALKASVKSETAAVVNCEQWSNGSSCGAKLENSESNSSDECEFYGFPAIEIKNGYQCLEYDSPKSPTFVYKSPDNFKPLEIPLERENEYDSPQSPISRVEDSIGVPNPSIIPLVRVGWENQHAAIDDQHHVSLIEGLIRNYNQQKQRMRRDYVGKNVERLKWILRKIVEKYLSESGSDVECKKCAKRLLKKVIGKKRLLCDVLYEIVEDTVEPVTNELTPPAPVMTKSHQKILSLIKMLNRLMGSFEKTFIFELDQRIFNLKSEKIKPEPLINLLLLYIGLIDSGGVNLNPARLIMYKSLYYYTKMSYPMIYYLLVTYPAMLPTKKEWGSGPQDPLVNCLLSILNSQMYNMANTEMKHREVFHILRLYYEYDRVKPSKEEVVDYLISRIRSEQFRNVSYAFALLCKRNSVEWSSSYVINDRLIPLLKEFSSQLKLEIVHDEQVACILDCLSAIAKPFPITHNIQTYRQLFIKILHTTDRQVIQEAAVLSILRTARFGYEECFKSIYSWNPPYRISRTLHLSLQSFVHRSPLKKLKQLEKTLL